MTSPTKRALSRWAENKVAHSEQFAYVCYELANKLLKLQARWLAAYADTEALPDIREIKDFSLALRKTQEVGQLALGEPTEMTQMELPLYVTRDESGL